ncbi:MAG TPA: PxKF domain-containing protein, partial [Roseiflexaceae bacterium]
GGYGGSQMAGGRGGSGYRDSTRTPSNDGGAGAAGIGGDAGSGGDYGGAGGGGGGYYGGGGGGGTTAPYHTGGGGGGGSGYGPAGVVFHSGVRAGDGLVTITYTAPDSTPPTASPTQAPPANSAGWNTSDVTVSWNWSDDRSGIDPASCTQSSTSSGEGSIPLTAACQDLAGNHSSATSTVQVDKTAPTVSAAATSVPNAAGWYNAPVTVHFTCADALSGIPAGACPADQILSADGAAVASTAQTVMDAAGNTSSPSNVVTVQIDTTAPTLAPAVNPNPVLLGGSATASPNATDALSGLASQSCNALDTSSVGLKSVSCTASDNAGNSASATLNYTVAYPWSGFFQPTDNLPTLNSVKAGSAIPVKFSLGGNQGLNIFAAGYPKVQPITCDSGTPSDEIEQTVTAGASGLSYDAASGQYSYTWKTENSWAGSCRQLIVRLIDGTDHIASFKFK